MNKPRSFSFVLEPQTQLLFRPLQFCHRLLCVQLNYQDKPSVHEMRLLPQGSACLEPLPGCYTAFYAECARLVSNAAIRVAISSSEAAAVLAINDTSFSKAKSPVDIVNLMSDAFMST